MADHGDRGVGPADQVLEQGQAGQVQVVGGLVEQEHVEAAEQERGQAHSGRLPARQRGHLLVLPDVEAHLGRRRTHPLLEVGRTEGEPALERRRVAVVRAGVAVREGLGRCVELDLGRAHPCAAGEVRCHGLTRATLGLLGQQSHARVGWGA